MGENLKKKKQRWSITRKMELTLQLLPSVFLESISRLQKKSSLMTAMADVEAHE